MITTAICLSGLLMCAGCGASNVSDSSNVSEESTVQVVSENTENKETTEKEDTKEQKAENTVAYAINIEKNNSWEQDGVKCTQYDGCIKNSTSDVGKDWKVVVTIPEGAKINDSWNGNYDISGNQLTITPVDYNKEIPGQAEITFGFIMGTQDEFIIDDAHAIISGESYAMNNENNASDKKEDSAVSKDETTAKETVAEETNKPEKTAKDKGMAVKMHGRLSVKGTDIVDKDGKNFQLKGISTHGLAWFPDYVNKDAFESLSEYGVNAMRLAMYTDESGGYCNGGDKSKLESLVFQGVDACKDLGMYVIIDWHVLREGDPNKYKDDAKVFFDMVSKKYADYENVIYEICNEPCNGTTWDQIKSYAEEVIPVIRNNDKNAIIIVGTPNWSQDVDIAADNPITGYDNIMYAVHFYAATHKEQIRNKVVVARDKGLPVIVSECSICEASGNGTVDYNEADTWMKYINDNKMSVFAWNLSNKDEKSSLIKAGVIKKSGFEPEDFSETGAWFMEQYGK